MANVYYEKDADRSLLSGRKVAVIGYGSQGHAHALNLQDSGIDVRVGLRPESSSVAKATDAGLRVLSVSEAAAEADLIVLLGPDTEHKAIFNEHIAPTSSLATRCSWATASACASTRWSRPRVST